MLVLQANTFVHNTFRLNFVCKFCDPHLFVSVLIVLDAQKIVYH